MDYSRTKIFLIGNKREGKPVLMGRDCADRPSGAMVRFQTRSVAGRQLPDGPLWRADTSLESPRAHAGSARPNARYSGHQAMT